MKNDPAIKYEKIKQFLLNNPNWLWQEKNQAISITDAKYFNIPANIKIIDYGDLFIVDCDGGLWICRWTRRLYRLSSGRLVPFRKIFELSSNMKIDYVNNFNGYAVLPGLAEWDHMEVME